MAVKSKVKAKVAVKPKAAKKLPSKSNIKVKPTRKLMTKSEAKGKSVVETLSVAKAPAKLVTKPVTLVVKRVINPLMPRRPIKRSQRANQFAYMKAPGLEHIFEVGDTVEVFCDHEKSRERIRGWVKGIVVQVDYKMVAVQFRSNVYLTDGWMVPDHILWFSLNSTHIRIPQKKSNKNSTPAQEEY